MDRNELKTKIQTILDTNNFDNKEFTFEDALFTILNQKMYMWSNVFNSWIYVHVDCFTTKELFVLKDILIKELG